MVRSRRVVAIMQPYFFPYIGYWQLMAHADVFVIMDRVKFVKRSWINRNFLLYRGERKLISVPLTKASDHKKIEERKVSENWNRERQSTVRRLEHYYGPAPFFSTLAPWLEELLFPEMTNLSAFLEPQIRATASLLSIETEIVMESELGNFVDVDRNSRIFDICKAVQSAAYINLPGGRSIYSQDSFTDAGLRLGFLNPSLEPYPQSQPEFVAGLSVIDTLLWSGPVQTSEMAHSGSISWQV